MIPQWPGGVEFVACADGYGCLTVEQLREFWKWFEATYDWIDYAAKDCVYGE